MNSLFKAATGAMQGGRAKGGQPPSSTQPPPQPQPVGGQYQDQVNIAPPLHRPTGGTRAPAPHPMADTGYRPQPQPVGGQPQDQANRAASMTRGYQLNPYVAPNAMGPAQSAGKFQQGMRKPQPMTQQVMPPQPHIAPALDMPTGGYQTRWDPSQARPTQRPTGPFNPYQPGKRQNWQQQQMSTMPQGMRQMYNGRPMTPQQPDMNYNPLPTMRGQPVGSRVNLQRNQLF